ncbi:hypothetical protein BH10BAC2_BH10BAC2_44760 [soil metagenome]
MSQKPVLLFSIRCVAHLYRRLILQLLNLATLNSKQKKGKGEVSLTIFKSLLTTSKKIVVVATLILVSSSCGNIPTSRETVLPSNDSSIFYPVQEYFITQIAHTDSSSNIIYTYTDSDNKKDFIIIDSAKFIGLAQPFIKDDINDISIKKYYKESVFNDVSTGSNTFTYTSVNADLPLQTIDILLDTTTDAVKRVFITKIFSRSDSLITEKLRWKTDHSFTITRLLQLPNKKETTQQINVLWNRNN